MYVCSRSIFDEKALDPLYASSDLNTLYTPPDLPSLDVRKRLLEVSSAPLHGSAPRLPCTCCDQVLRNLPCPLTTQVKRSSADLELAH